MKRNFLDPPWRILLLPPAWWVISEGRPDALAVGLPAVVLAAALSLIILPRPRLRPRVTQLPGFLVFFLLHSWRAGLLVARSALGPRRSLRPELLQVRISLPEGGARWLLAALLGLLPGTLCLALEGERMTLHSLSGEEGIEEEVRMLERRVARLLGLPPEPAHG